MAGGGIVSGPRKLAEIVREWQPARTRVAPRDDASGVFSAWADVVGPDIAKRTRPAKYRDGTLTVHTPASTWSHQLTFLAPGIIGALREHCAGSGVMRLRFVVASGRTKALLDGAVLRRSEGRMPAASAAAFAEPIDPTPVNDSEDVAAMIRRVRQRQLDLDRRRSRAGWKRCDRCKSWRPPVPSTTEAAAGAATCAVCDYETERKADERIERILMQAPWLRARDVRAIDPRTNDEAYARVRRRLLTRWEEHLSWSRRRLRRGTLQPPDRLIAWSYIMLLGNVRQQDIGRAVIADVLGAQWADALAGDAEASAQEAHGALREKHANTNPRALKKAT